MLLQYGSWDGGKNGSLLRVCKYFPMIYYILKELNLITLMACAYNYWDLQVATHGKLRNSSRSGIGDWGGQSLEGGTQ